MLAGGAAGGGGWPTPRYTPNQNQKINTPIGSSSTHRNAAATEPSPVPCFAADQSGIGQINHDLVVSSGEYHIAVERGEDGGRGQPPEGGVEHAVVGALRCDHRQPRWVVRQVLDGDDGAIRSTDKQRSMLPREAMFNDG